MFTIGMVNYKTSELIDTQLKIYKDFAGEEFKIIIVDTSNDAEEFHKLFETSKISRVPCQVIQLQPEGKFSGPHGEGLQYIYNLVDTEYFLTQDPDFFWVLPNFLTFLKEKLQYHTVVGAPYHKMYIEMLDKCGTRSNFPAAFGAAYRMSELRAIAADFRANMRKSRPRGDKIGITRDVGWQIREMLNGPYCSFDQQKCESALQTSEEKISCTYLYKGRVIAHHLQRCSCYQGWQENRKKMCDFFWKEINDAAKRTV